MEIKMEYREATEAEHEALEAFAAAHKKPSQRARSSLNWREELGNVYWYNARLWRGPKENMGSILHGIRNDLGPTWLFDYYKPRKL